MFSSKSFVVLTHTIMSMISLEVTLVSCKEEAQFHSIAYKYLAITYYLLKIEKKNLEQQGPFVCGNFDISDLNSIYFYDFDYI